MAQRPNPKGQPKCEYVQRPVVVLKRQSPYMPKWPVRVVLLRPVSSGPGQNFCRQTSQTPDKGCSSKPIAALVTCWPRETIHEFAHGPGRAEVDAYSVNNPV